MIGFEDYIDKQKRILHELREEFSVKQKELDIVNEQIVNGRNVNTLLEEKAKNIQNDIYSMQNTIRIETESLQKLEDRKLQQNIEKKSLEDDIGKLILRKSVLEDSIINLGEEEVEKKSKNKELESKNNSLVKSIQKNTQILEGQAIQIEKQNNIFKKREKNVELKELLVEQREKQVQANESFISDTIENIKHL